MEILLLTLAMVAVLMLVMAVGVVFGGKPLKGSCGGVGGPECVCEAAGKPPGTACEDDPPKPGADGVVVYE